MIAQMHTMIQDIINNMKLTDYRIGNVIQLNPIKIDFGEGKVISDVGTNILYTEQVLEKKIDLQHYHTLSNLIHSHGDAGNALSGSFNSDNKLTTYIINQGIKKDDKLLMLRVANGQKWIVLSILRDKNKVSIGNDNSWNWS
ncbi:MAG TPA: hypothetical protein DC000_00130 [Clostridiales bacterium]|nr:hypothetical protein [Clostridiales bacterium]